MKLLIRAARLLEEEAKVIWASNVVGYRKDPNFGKMVDPWAIKRHKALTSTASGLRSLVKLLNRKKR